MGFVQVENELIFPWLSWLAVLLVGAYEITKSRKMAAILQLRLTETCALSL